LHNVSVWAKSPTDMLYFTSVEAIWVKKPARWANRIYRVMWCN